MYLYLNSSSHKRLFPSNIASNFTVKTPKVLDVSPSGGCSIALLDIELPEFADNYKTKYISVYCSLCQPSLHGAELRPVLTRLYFNDVKHGGPFRFDTPRYIPLNTGSLNYFNIFILDDKDLPPSFNVRELLCTLHITKKNGINW